MEIQEINYMKEVSYMNNQLKNENGAGLLYWNWPPKVQRKRPRKYITSGHQSTQYLATEMHK